jgi:hypothetical protein
LSVHSLQSSEERRKRGALGLAVEEFFEEKAGEAFGVVADDAVFFEEVVEDDADAELL